MKITTFLITIFLLSCSTDEHTFASRGDGTLTLDVKVLDSSGQISSLEESIKHSLAVTLLDEHEVAIQSWKTLETLPRSISLPSGTYYAIVETREVVSAQENTLTYYARTAPIYIIKGQHQSRELTFKDQMSPPAFSDFSFE